MITESRQAGMANGNLWRCRLLIISSALIQLELDGSAGTTPGQATKASHGLLKPHTLDLGQPNLQQPEMRLPCG
jgi:hypothetical protein